MATRSKSSGLSRIGGVLCVGVLLIAVDSVISRTWDLEYSLGFPGLRLWTIGTLALVVGFIWTVAILVRHP
ncbi:MAG: hypothetical protein LBE08_03300 [Bifidobacteriaceae bacterium]|jgi:hypothetical protein|nr:hypothetical protein [Bifidobacteriaceae bacterium]